MNKIYKISSLIYIEKTFYRVNKLKDNKLI